MGKDKDTKKSTKTKDSKDRKGTKDSKSKNNRYGLNPVSSVSGVEFTPSIPART